MTGRLIQVTKSAYQYPLLIKQLWHTPLLHEPDQEIVYRDTSASRTDSFTSALDGSRPVSTGLVSARGDTVGVLGLGQQSFSGSLLRYSNDGGCLADGKCPSVVGNRSHTRSTMRARRYFSSRRLRARSGSIKQQLPKVKTLILMSDRGVPQTGGLSFAGEYEDLLLNASPDHSFPDFDENTLATTFYTTGTLVRRRVSTSAIANWFSIHSPKLAFWVPLHNKVGFCRDDVYMPITRCFTCTPGGFRGRRRFPASSKCILDATIPAFLLKLIKPKA